ncbi:ADP-ribosyltransferase [Bacillus cereus]
MSIIKGKIFRSILIAVTFFCMFSFANPVQIWAAESDEIVSNHIDGLIDFEGNYEEAGKWGENKYKEWQESLTRNEKDMIKLYTDSEFLKLNAYLRKTKGILKDIPLYEKNNEVIKVMDKVLKKTKTETPITVYRKVKDEEYGIDVLITELAKLEETMAKENEELPAEVYDKLFISEIEEKLKGKVITNYGYTSTSLGTGFYSKAFRDHYILMKIKLPAGTNAAYVAQLSKYPGEYEMLVARGFTYKIEDLSWIVLNGEKMLEIVAKGIKK